MIQANHGSGQKSAFGNGRCHHWIRAEVAGNEPLDGWVFHFSLSRLLHDCLIQSTFKKQVWLDDNRIELATVGQLFHI